MGSDYQNIPFIVGSTQGRTYCRPFQKLQTPAWLGHNNRFNRRHRGSNNTPTVLTLHKNYGLGGELLCLCGVVLCHVRCRWSGRYPPIQISEIDEKATDIYIHTHPTQYQKIQMGEK